MKKREATVVMAKCCQSKKTYGIRVEKTSENSWDCTWAFKLSEKSAGNEGYGSKLISGNIDINEEYPGCPYCGSGGWVLCAKCGKLSCYKGESQAACAWCGYTADVSDSDTFDLQGGEY